MLERDVNQGLRTKELAGGLADARGGARTRNPVTPYRMSLFEMREIVAPRNSDMVFILCVLVWFCCMEEAGLGGIDRGGWWQWTIARLVAAWGYSRRAKT